MAALEIVGAAASAGRLTTTSASSPMGGSCCGMVSKMTLANISSVTTSALGSMRSILPLNVLLH